MAVNYDVAETLPLTLITHTLLHIDITFSLFPIRRRSFCDERRA